MLSMRVSVVVNDEAYIDVTDMSKPEAVEILERAKELVDAVNEMGRKQLETAAADDGDDWNGPVKKMKKKPIITPRKPFRKDPEDEDDQEA